MEVINTSLDENYTFEELINKYDTEWFTFNEKLYKDTRNMEYVRYLNVIENSEENDDSSNLANLAFAYEITYNDEKAIELYNRAINLNENNITENNIQRITSKYIKSILSFEQKQSPKKDFVFLNQIWVKCFFIVRSLRLLT